MPSEDVDIVQGARDVALMVPVLQARVAELEAIGRRLHAAYVIEEDTNGFPFSFELRDAHRELRAALKGKRP